MPRNKKIAYICCAFLLVVIIAVGMVGMLSLLRSKGMISGNGTDQNTSKDSPITKKSADDLKSQGFEAVKNNDFSKAKALLQKAKQQYIELKNDNEDLADVNAELYYVNHLPTTPAPTKTTLVNYQSSH
jgi:hypothetical protein